MVMWKFGSNPPKELPNFNRLFGFLRSLSKSRRQRLNLSCWINPKLG